MGTDLRNFHYILPIFFVNLLENLQKRNKSKNLGQKINNGINMDGNLILFYPIFGEKSKILWLINDL